MNTRLKDSGATTNDRKIVILEQVNGQLLIGEQGESDEKVFHLIRPGRIQVVNAQGTVQTQIVPLFPFLKKDMQKVDSIELPISWTSITWVQSLDDVFGLELAKNFSNLYREYHSKLIVVPGVK